MNAITHFLVEYWVAIVVTLVILLSLILLVFRARSEVASARYSPSEDFGYAVGPDGKVVSQRELDVSLVSIMVAREDLTLRVIEEVIDLKTRMVGSVDAIRLHKLERIRFSLRSVLRASVNEDNFPSIRDRILTLLDQIKAEAEALQSKEPFTDIQDPERSLLMDLFAEIHQDKKIAQQKAIQLASIIKIKHQDILKLQSENAKATIWTKWGTAGTVVFGILSIILSIVTLKP